jgi:hypothetical protein
MPVHDWTRVPGGTFHHFHAAWIPLLADVLNQEALPPGYYAMAEQVAGIVPDVVTLQAHDEAASDDATGTPSSTLVASPPRAAIMAQLEVEQEIYAARANRLVIRHQSGDRVVAILEIISPGNKSSRSALDKFVNKATEALWQGIHLLLIDLHPPSRRDPNGLHGAIWEALGGEGYRQPIDKPLTVASYAAYSEGRPIEAFVEPLGVGDVLPAMPLFLAPGRHALVPLEASYLAAVSRIPARARQPLEA